MAKNKKKNNADDNYYPYDKPVFDENIESDDMGIENTETDLVENNDNLEKKEEPESFDKAVEPEVKKEQEVVIEKPMVKRVKKISTSQTRINKRIGK